MSEPKHTPELWTLQSDTDTDGYVGWWIVQGVNMIADLRHCENAEAHAREIVDAHNAARWQPIETAPKDGTLLIGFVPESALYEVIFIRHYEDEDCWRHDMGNETVPMDVEPTHWMAIPDRPR